MKRTNHPPREQTYKLQAPDSSSHQLFNFFLPSP